MNSNYSYYIHQDCIACDTCITIAPDCFGLDIKNQTAVIKMQPIHSHDQDKCQKAMKACPVAAIRIEK